MLGVADGQSDLSRYAWTVFLTVQLPPTLLTRTSFSGLRRVESARLTRVLNSMLGIVDGRSELSR